MKTRKKAFIRKKKKSFVYTVELKHAMSILKAEKDAKKEKIVFKAFELFDGGGAGEVR